MRYPWIFPFLFLLLAGSAVDLRSQVLADSLQLNIFDTNGLENRLVLGHHADASMDYDHHLKESAVPPVPFDQVFDARFLDPPSHRRTPNSGSYRDIRGIGQAVADTFLVSCQPMNGGYPVTVLWNAAVAVVSFTTAELRSIDGARLLCDMQSAHQLKLSSAEESRFMIIIRR